MIFYADLSSPFILRDEEWLDIRKPLVQELMAPRFYKAVAEGCHGIEPDNIDCYQARSSVAFTSHLSLAHDVASPHPGLMPLTMASQNKDCWSKMTNPSVSSGNDLLPQQTAYDMVRPVEFGRVCALCMCLVAAILGMSRHR